MFEDDTEYKLRFRANGTIEVERRTEDGTQLYELEENPLVDENWGTSDG